MNYYPHHLGDYAKDTGSLTMLEHGAYRLLLDALYAGERPIPQEDVYREAKAVTKADRAAVDYVLKKFFDLLDGGYTQRRALREIAILNVARERAKTNGKRGGRPPKQNPAETQRVISGLPNENPAETQRVISGLPNENPAETQSGTTRARPHEPTTQDPVLLEKEPKRSFDFGDEEIVFPVRKKRQPRKSDKDFPLPPSVESALRRLYRRKDSTPWTPKEIHSAKALDRIPEDQLLAEITMFEKAREAGWQFYRRDMQTLLNNWTAEVERSEDFLRPHSNGNGNGANGHHDPLAAAMKPNRYTRPLSRMENIEVHSTDL